MMTKHTVDSERENIADYEDRVMAYGDGLTYGVVGEACKFKIHIGQNSGEGTLSVGIVGPSKVPITFSDNKDRTCSITYLPTEPGKYHVSITFGDKHIPGSPFNADIIGKEIERTEKNEMGTLSLRVSEDDIGQLTATIEKPSGSVEGCKLKRLFNGNLGIFFAIRESGEHIVNVKKDGRHVRNSPFKIRVAEKEVADASKVKVSELVTDGVIVGQLVKFFVDTTDAGYGTLDVTIEGPSKATVDLQDISNGSCVASYRPVTPGNYILNVKYSDQHVPGSPFLVNVQGESPDVLTSRKVSSGLSTRKRVCELELKIPDADQKDIKAHVIDPTSTKVNASVIGGPASSYTVRFIPTIPGAHLVVVTHKGIHVKGSPFPFTVTPAGNGDSSKVRAIGHGLEGGIVGEKCNFTVLLDKVGPGKVTIGVDGPAKVKLELDDKCSTSRQVSYLPTLPGEYVIGIKYNNEHIYQSPFKVFIRSAGDDCKPPNTNVIHTTEMSKSSNDVIIAKVISPSGVEDDCLITESEGNYDVGFIPKTNGIHMIHVEVNGESLTNSPFSVLVDKVAEDQKMIRLSLTKKSMI